MKILNLFKKKSVVCTYCKQEIRDVDRWYELMRGDGIRFKVHRECREPYLKAYQKMWDDIGKANHEKFKNNPGYINALKSIKH